MPVGLWWTGIVYTSLTLPPYTLLVAHGDASRIMVDRDSVHQLELAAFLLQNLLQRIHVHAVLLDWNLAQAQSPLLEHIVPQVVGGSLRHHAIAICSVDTTGDVGCHGGATSGHQVGSRDVLAVFGRKVAAERLEEDRMTQHEGTLLLGSVVEARDSVLGNRFGVRFTQTRLERFPIDHRWVRPPLDEILLARWCIGSVRHD